ncbi:MAG: MFS transporter [Candidatus Bathyarchaeota archaeon]|nr:MFS transporter [Candidatus Bathyarchaeota archaeon]
MTKKERVLLGLRGNALVLTLTEFLITCGMFLTNPFWSLYVLELGASIYDLALFSLLTGLVPAAFIAPVGYLGDRMNRKKLIIVGNLLSCFGPLLNAFATNWMQLLPGTLIGSMMRVFNPVTQAFVAEDISPSERGKAYATRFTLLMIPGTFTPTVAGIFIDTMGFETGMRYMLFLNAGMRFIMVALIVRFLKEGTASPRTQRIGKLKLSSLRPALSEMFKPLLSNKTLRVMATGSAASAFSMGMMMRFQSVYVVEVIGLTKTDWGLITSWVAIVRILTRIPLGGLADKWGRRRSILINYCLQPLCTFALAFSNDFITVFFAMAARTLVFNVGMPAWQAMIADIAPSNERGTVYGSMGTVQIIVQSVAPIVGGTAWDAFSPEWIFYLAALGRAFSAGWLLKFLKEPEQRAE